MNLQRYTVGISIKKFFRCCITQWKYIILPYLPKSINFRCSLSLCQLMVHHVYNYRQLIITSIILVDNLHYNSLSHSKYDRMPCMHLVYWSWLLSAHNYHNSMSLNSFLQINSLTLASSHHLPRDLPPAATW